MIQSISSALCICFLVIYLSTNAAENKAGFFLPEDVPEITFAFQSVNNLIILPVLVNDSVKLNLILDTGCRNLVLFGKKFRRFFHTEPDKTIEFSGLGNGKRIEGKLSLNNKVSIHSVVGEKIPLVIVPEQNLFSAYPNIHGVIGYDIFIKFEIEINSVQSLITFRPAGTATLGPGFDKIPIRIDDSRPLIQSQIFFGDAEAQPCDLLLDTGSSLGLLLKTSDVKKFPSGTQKSIVGRGFNGNIFGIVTVASKLSLHSFEMVTLPAAITYSAWHNYASVGMEVLKNYTIVLNYCKAYAGIKKAL